MYNWFVRRSCLRIILIFSLSTPLLAGGENAGGTTSTLAAKSEHLGSEVKILVENLRQKLDALEKQSGHKCAIARLKILQLESVDKAKFLGKPAGYKQVLLRKTRTELDEIFRFIKAGKDPLADRTGLIEGAYISQVDGSVQPYHLYIPTSFNNAEDPANPESTKLPMVIRYHGYNPSYKRTSWIEVGKRTTIDFEKTGMAMLMPFGRSNTDFLSVGEVDVFAALESVAKLYPIDRSRLYLSGYSMGGSGVWTTLAHYPGVFAAAYIRSGRSDYYYWHNLKREEIPDYLRLLIDTDNPIDLAENIRAVPLRIYHPKGDKIVKPGHTTCMVERLNELGRAMLNGVPAPLEANTPPGGSHWDFRSQYTNQEIYKWMLNYQSEQNPTEVEITTFTPKYGKRAWLQIETIKDWGKRAYVRARIDTEAGIIVIEEIENVSLLSIDPQWLPHNLNKDNWIDVTPLTAAMLHHMVPPLQVPEKYSVVYPRASGLLSWSYQIIEKGEGEKPIPELRKTPGLCGPVKEAFNSPFMLVRGTIGTPEETMSLMAMCKRFEKEWLLFAKGEARTKDDVDITYYDRRRYNLVCFGNPQTNSYLASIEHKLPFKFFPDGYGVGEAVVRGEEGEKLGFLGCFPNPRTDVDHLIVVVDGLYYGDFLQINHKWDLVPDYLVFTDKKGYEGTNQAKLTGFFNSSWEVDSKLQYRDQQP